MGISASRELPTLVLYYTSMAEAAKFSAQREKQHRISHYDTRLRPLSLGRRVQLRLLAGVGLAAARTIGPTLRFEVLGWQHIERVHGSGRRCVYSFWHRTIFLAMWC